MQLAPGLYEAVIDDLLSRQLSAPDFPLQSQIEDLDASEMPIALARHLEKLIQSAFASLHGQNGNVSQVALFNAIVARIESAVPDLRERQLPETPRQLLSLHDKIAFQRPETPLAISSLLTGTRLDPSLLSQLKREIAACDRIDILCSFIKWSGIRVLENELRAFLQKPGAQLRVITTSYMGATDARAIEFLASLDGAQIKVSYDTHRTRLHAKAYMFGRDSGFGAAYVGSSNLSNAALTDGLEWNVKVSQFETPHLWQKIGATFETYWNDSDFELYTLEDAARLQIALRSERAGETAPTFHFDLRPYGFQSEILERLQVERAIENRHKHLVVAATGTGKTMIAAFDYRNWRAENPNASLLFVAHREEILDQALATFRAVLRDQNFGEKLVGISPDPSGTHIFASIQSYNSRELWRRAPDMFDYVVVDEFHHAAAPSYEKLLNHVRSGVLLGLTATPERADGLDVARFFDGHISAQIRLPDAINRKLLSPFQYFGVSDSVDLSGLQWSRGGYDIDSLSQLYTDNDERAALIIQKTREKLTDVAAARGLGFCVSIAHAEFMAEVFRRAGIAAEALSANSSADARQAIRGKLQRREINFIFAVDLFNEGVDIPEIDTVLFLRPTESLTVFLQQLGRGLRLHPEKETLTVLDFIGQPNRNFRFDLRFRALQNDAMLPVKAHLEAGFPHLPAGCVIELERVARERILENVAAAAPNTQKYLERELRALAAHKGAPPTLDEFLKFLDCDAAEFYRRDLSLCRLETRAGLRPDWSSPDEALLSRGLRRISHADSASWIRHLLSVLNGSAAADSPQWTMALFSLMGPNLPTSGAAGLARLQNNPELMSELKQLLTYRLGQIASIAPLLDLPFDCPLELHASYTRDEILVALGHTDLARQPAMREGVLHLPHLPADAFFMTLNKSDKDYSPSTMYDDYALSDTLFHWQSQNATSETSPTGQRYIEHQKRGHSILLFAREHKNAFGLAAPYAFLGAADYESHSGNKPMSILWRLHQPLNARLLRALRRLIVD